MKKAQIFFMVLFLVVMTMNISPAATYTYDFSSYGYAPDQDLEGMVKDLATFTSEDGGLKYLVWEGYYAGIGGGWSQYGHQGDADIYITFSAPVDQVVFRAGDGGGDFDAFAVSVYEFGTDSFLGAWTTPLFGGPENEPEFYTLTINAANIGRVVFDPGNSGNLPGVMGNGGGVVIEDMSYTTAAVPEPFSLLLLGLGLMGIAAAGRKCLL